MEQFDIPHDHGSSHGMNRVIRLAYSEHPSYVPLLRRAYELWRELEHLTEERLLIITGGIDAGPEGCSTVKGSRLSCDLHHLPHETMNAAELHRRFPGYRLADDMMAVYQPNAGFVLSERAIVAHVVAAQTLGADVHAREPVLNWDANGGGVRVRTSRDTYAADRLVITAGPWAAKLVPALARAAVPGRQGLLWPQPMRLEYFRLGAFPVFNMEARKGGSTVSRCTGYRGLRSENTIIAAKKRIQIRWTGTSIPRRRRCCAREFAVTSPMPTDRRWQ